MENTAFQHQPFPLGLFFPLFVFTVYLFYFDLKKIIFNVYLFLRQRETEHELGRAKREGDTESEAGSRL